MRRSLPRAFVLAIGLAALGAAAVAPAFAQFGGDSVYQADPRRGYRRPPPTSYPRGPYPAPGAYYQPGPSPYQPAPGQPGYRPGRPYPGAMVQPAQPQPGFSLRRLFGIEDEPPPRQVFIPQAPRVKPIHPRPAPTAVAARPVKPKVNPSSFVVVFGDGLADQTAQGLEEAFEETPDVAVVRKTKTDGGLARSEPGDWPKFVRDTLDGGQKATVAVVMLGANDRQPIKDGEQSQEPLTDRWKDLYRDRVDAVVKALTERGLPVVWIGVPPIKNDKLSADYIAMNEISRESVERLGGTYVDIWPGFVNDENRYATSGPDVDGQTLRLRNSDGVLFTRAGARKAAHFADAEIKRLIEARKSGTAIAAVPGAGLPVDGTAPVDPLLALPPVPEVPGTPPLPSKPIAGPILPLTRPDLSPGGTLASTRPKLDGDAAYTVQKALREGIPTSPRPGRADDYRWPKL